MTRQTTISHHPGNHPPRQTGRVLGLTLLAGLLLAGLGGAGNPSKALSSGNEEAEKVDDDGANKPAQMTPDRRLREGTDLVDQPGFFRMTGDRITFYADIGSGRFMSLENLNLERITRIITDNPQQLEWEVTGTITEYQGTNYLLIRRAVLRSRLPSADETVF